MNQTRTIGILAHVDAGKTTLTEAMLFRTGQIRTAGRVDHGDTHLDTDDQERERGITIFSKQARLGLPGLTVTILDTPGHTDFSAETERTLQVLDAAVLVISGTDGVQGHTRTLWRLLERYRLPVLIFVNKMDLPGADRDKVTASLGEELSSRCVDFTAGLPERDEEIALTDEKLLDTLLEDGSLPDPMIAEAVGRRKLFPVWFGSAFRMEGVDALLEGFRRYLPEKTYPSAFGMKVYKIGRDAQGKRLSGVKVTGGVLRVRDAVTYHPGGKDADAAPVTEKIDQIRLFAGDRYTTVTEAPAGTVCAVTGLSAVMPGQGLGAEPDSEPPVLEPVMTRRLILPEGTDPAAVFRELHVLEDEDPALHLTWNAERKDIHIQIMGQVQTEVLTRLIRGRFGIAVSFGPERIMYRETAAAPAEGVGHYEPLRHYAEVHLLIEPGERGSGITAASSLSTDELDANWQKQVLNAVLDDEHPGVLTGSPLTDVKITLVGGRASVKHTEGGDFRQAADRAVRQGLRRTKSILLEPWYAFEINLPEDALGHVMSELLARHASCGDPEYHQGADDTRMTLRGSLPVSESSDLELRLHAASRGRARLTLTLDGYRTCHNAEEMIRRIAYDPEADTAHPTGSVFCSHGSGFFVPWDQVETYMHLPYSGLTEAGRQASDPGTEEGFRPETPEEHAPGGDDELDAIYKREFGRTRDDVPIGGKERLSRKRYTAPRRTDPVKQKTDKHGRPIYPKKDTREELLLIDGYNVIFDWPELRDLARADMAAARGKLLDEISNYQGFTGVRTCVVFDAYRRERTPASVTLYQNLTVVFTEKDETADAWIERTVHEGIGKYRITVVTSDGLEQLTVMRIGAMRMSSRMLLEEIRRVREEGKGTQYT